MIFPSVLVLGFKKSSDIRNFQNTYKIQTFLNTIMLWVFWCTRTFVMIRYDIIDTTSTIHILLIVNIIISTKVASSFISSHIKTGPHTDKNREKIMRKRQKIVPNPLKMRIFLSKLANYSPILTKTFSPWENWGKPSVPLSWPPHDPCQCRALSYHLLLVVHTKMCKAL